MNKYFRINDKVINLMDISVLDLRMPHTGIYMNPIIILNSGYKLEFTRYNMNTNEYDLFMEIVEYLTDDSNMVDPVCITGEISTQK